MTAQPQGQEEGWGQMGPCTRNDQSEDGSLRPFLLSLGNSVLRCLKAADYASPSPSKETRRGRLLIIIVPATMASC